MPNQIPNIIFSGCGPLQGKADTRLIHLRCAQLLRLLSAVETLLGSFYGGTLSCRRLYFKVDLHTLTHARLSSAPNMSLGTISFSHDSPHTAALALGCLCLCQCQLYFTKYEITSCVLNYERQSLPRQYT